MTSGSRAVATALMFFGLLACRDRDRAPITIGWAGPATDSIGAASLRAARLAVEEINAGGGIGGRQLELLAADDGGEADSAVRVAEMLVASPVVAVIGHIYSSATLAAAPVYNGARPVVEISPSSSSPEISGAGPYTFRVCPSDDRYGAELARWASRRLGLTQGAVVYVNDDYGRGFRRTFTQEYERLGGTVTEVDPFLATVPEAEPYLDRIGRSTAEFLVLAANIDEGQVVLRQVRGRGLSLPLLAGDGFDGIEDAGAIAEGIYVTTGYLANDPSPANQRLVAAYRARYPGAGPLNQPAAATYDIVHLLRRVLTEAGTGREAVREALARVGNADPPFVGVTGTIAFDSLGDAPTVAVHMGVVQSGVLRPAEER
jgi:branched-chain amino acid transport system substrate-binding protein